MLCSCFTNFPFFIDIDIITSDATRVQLLLHITNDTSMDHLRKS